MSALWCDLSMHFGFGGREGRRRPAIMPSNGGRGGTDKRRLLFAESWVAQIQGRGGKEAREISLVQFASPLDPPSPCSQLGEQTLSNFLLRRSLLVSTYVYVQHSSFVFPTKNRAARRSVFTILPAHSFSPSRQTGQKVQKLQTFSSSKSATHTIRRGWRSVPVSPRDYLLKSGQLSLERGRGACSSACRYKGGESVLWDGRLGNRKIVADVYMCKLFPYSPPEDH